MNTLNIVQRNTISLQNWDNFVTQIYGKPYCFQQQDGCKYRGVETITTSDIYDYENTTVPEVINGEEMGVSFKAWLDRDPKEWNGKDEDKEFLDLFWDRNFYPHVSMIANDLVQKGLLEPGEYDIIIDW